MHFQSKGRNEKAYYKLQYFMKNLFLIQSNFIFRFKILRLLLVLVLILWYEIVQFQELTVLYATKGLVTK